VEVFSLQRYECGILEEAVGQVGCQLLSRCVGIKSGVNSASGEKKTAVVIPPREAKGILLLI
jgi:hypothetical protein